jgi:uncharacterized protein
LDIAALRAGGHTPVPFREFVLKIHQRCNLACDYCYMYEHADQSWRERPRTMSDEVLDATLGRIADHARQFGLPRVRIVLHGGEPLLYGRDRLAALVEKARAVVPCPVDVSMQTNGVLLDDLTLAVVRSARITVGVSVDGTPAEHDKHRRTPGGKGSFTAVAKALTLLQKPSNRQVYGGLLCTVNVAADPIACYEQLLAFAPPAIDLLLPHANWAYQPAPGHASWLSTVFDRWYADRSPVRIRLFDDAIALMLGGSGRGEQLGLSPSGVVVVESDGAIEQVDALKSAYEGACSTGKNVLSTGFDAVLDHPGIVARQIGRAALADECLACPAVAFCGGGHYAHRYRPGVGFRAPSAYCADLRVFLRHVYDRVAADLPAHLGSPT